MNIFTDRTFAENAYINRAKELADGLGISLINEKGIVNIVIKEEGTTYKFDSAYYALLFMQGFSRGYSFGYIKGSKN